MTDAVSPAERLAALFDRHGTDLYRVARRQVSTADDALDLVQETFLRAAGALDRVPGNDADARAWLVRVLLNIRKDQWRKASVRRRLAEPTAPPAATANPESAYIDHATVWRALDRLPPRRRAIVTLVELDGMPIRDIATLLGISAITVRWHLSRGRRELARAIAHLGEHHHGQPHANAEERRPAPPRTVEP